MNSPNVYLILDFMFLYIVLHEIYMINIDPITFFLNFLYIKDADHSSPKLLLITITITMWVLRCGYKSKENCSTEQTGRREYMICI